MASDSSFDPVQIRDPATQEELNSWRRGFTPQAEIWNGRMAMLGLAIGLSTVTIVHLLTN